jgi:hypothetical protein
MAIQLIKSINSLVSNLILCLCPIIVKQVKLLKERCDPGDMNLCMEGEI